MGKMRVAVFASGSGTNLQAIIDADIQTIEIAVVFTNNPDAYAIERAKKHNIQVEIIDHKNYKTREEYEKHIIKVLGPYKLNLIVLAGFMRILSTVFVRAYKNKIVNTKLLQATSVRRRARHQLHAELERTTPTRLQPAVRLALQARPE